MTAPELRTEETPIVVHGPINGDPARAATVVRPAPVVTTTETLASPSYEARLAAAPVVSVAPTERVLGLDAFRGLLILAMNFAFTIPEWGPFPAWMYHTQVPPSVTGAYANIAGLTWRDMLFPMFMFTMSAAIPVVMGARLAKGKPYPEILWIAVRRAFLLTVFALIIGHVNPYWTHDYTKRGNLVAIAGLCVAFLTFVQPPKGMSATGRKWLRRAGWAGTAATLFALPLLYGQHFDWYRRDDIIASIAFCNLAATTLWLFTRGRARIRLGVFAAIIAARALAPHVAWVASLWNAQPLPWFYEPWYMELMLIAIPGTIAGDLVFKLMSSRKAASHAPTETETPAWSMARLALIAALGLSFFVTLNVGLYHRQYAPQTAIATVVMAIALVLATRGAATPRERVLSRMFLWSSVWLVAGALTEPLEGGIKKDPQTLGYLLLMAGVATAGLAAMLVVLDSFRSAGKRLRPLVLVGQNSLFAYVVYMLGIGHLLWLAGIGTMFTATWPQAALRSVVLTTITGTVVWFATRKRLIWKT